MSTSRTKVISSPRGKSVFKKVSVSDFAEINKERLPEKLKKDFGRGASSKAFKLVLPGKAVSSGLKERSKRSTAKYVLKGSSKGTAVITGTLKSQKDVVGFRIRYEAASNSGKLHIVHSKNQWKIYPEDSDISLFNTKRKSRAIEYGKMLIDKGCYNTIVVHTTYGLVSEFIVKENKQISSKK